MTRKLLVVVICSLSLCFTAKAQVDSILHQGGFRTFIVHLPTGYNSAVSYPLILNFHGLGETALQQEIYTGFDAIADTAKFIVVYPQGLSNSWNIGQGGADDINFATVLIDTLLQQYSIDAACVYSTGLSNGAYLSFILACDISYKLAGVAPVAGNMTTLQQLVCSPVKGMPVMEIHGTADAIVSYNGSAGVSTVPANVNWWVNKNMCTTTPSVFSVPDINTTDGCTATRYTYSNGNDNSEVIHYMITGGGHTWPGGIPVVSLGNTCGDFNASEEIWKFFRKHCAHITSVNELTENDITVYPNPFTNLITIKLPTKASFPKQIEITNTLGQIIMKKSIRSIAMDNTLTIDTGTIPSGIYLVRINNYTTRLIKIN